MLFPTSAFWALLPPACFFFLRSCDCDLKPHVFCSMRIFLMIAFINITSTTAIAQDPPAISGPMVGHATASSAKV